MHSVGGVDVSLRTILAQIDKDTFEQIVVHGKTDTNSPFLLRDQSAATSYQIDIQREIHLFKDIKAVFQLLKILKECQPSLIHAHSAKGGLVARLAGIFYKVNILHTPQAYSFLSKPKGFKRSLFLIVERWLKQFNSILLASSTSELNRGITEVGYKKEKALLFNNAIQPVFSQKENDFVKTLPDKFIATVGRPSFQKNIESMLEVILLVKKDIPDIKLVLMGVGHYSPNLENVKSLVKKLDLEENVIFIKWQERSNILNAIAASQLYISTARYEGLPYSVIEAMAVKTALVLTDVDGNRDLVNHNYNGYLVVENNHKVMASHIVHLLHNEKIRKQMAHNSKVMFDKHFNMHKQIHILQDIYINTSIN